MDCSWAEETGFDRRKDAADELLRGREFAQQLGGLLRRSSSSSGASQDLLSRILTSFSNTLSILNHNNNHSDDINGGGSVIVDSKSDESGDSSINCHQYPRSSRPGCYKRRKRSHSWARESGKLVDDGQAWRKYGQKVILNAKYPRNYYRCTHKFDQSCQATKQVQQLQDNPPNFRTTYYGNHTCTNFLNHSPQILLGGTTTAAASSYSSEVLLSFDITTQPQPQPQPQPQLLQHDHFFFPPPPPANNNVNVCSPSDYMSAGPSPDHLSVLDFDHEFHF